MHDARKITNLLLTEFDPVRYAVSNLKLNKVLFYVHAYHLVRHSQPLVRNHFEAWEHGPVVRVIYQEFKSFGSSPITKLAHFLNYETGQHEPVAFDDIDEAQRRFVIGVAQHYMKFSAARLREMTHEVGGAWHKTYTSSLDNRGLRDRIPNELIQTLLAREIGQGGSLN